MQTFFIAGTDTDIGKTYVSQRLLEYFNRQHHCTLGFKPIASGAEKTTDGLRNSDALALQKSSSLDCNYDVINPFVFEPPIAPHLAAELAGQTLSVQALLQKTQQLHILSPDKLVIEGAGGLLVPLNQQQCFSDFLTALRVPAIVVVGIKLGCLNHALLTMTALKHYNIPCAGWVANCLEPNMLFVDENITTLKQRIDAPLLATVQYQQQWVDFAL